MPQTPESFMPEKLPIDSEAILKQNFALVKLLNTANKKLGEYKGYLNNLMNPSLLISPLLAQEAVLSSKLEGTRATLDDLLSFDADAATNKDKDELKEVANYRQALYYAIDNIAQYNSPDDKKLPLCSRLIQAMHKILLDNVRGSTKNPGSFKRQQNYIVSPSGLVFTPVPPLYVNEYMSNLENYIHADDFSILLQIAMIHAQFEMIHPFEDGNGRIGRLLIPLFLFYRGELPLPTFYMSSYFNRDRSLYLSKLHNISLHNDWASWFEYFLNGIIASSSEGTQKAIQINELYSALKNSFIFELKSAYSIQVLDFIFQHPVFTARQLEAATGIPQRTVYTLLGKLTDMKILSQNSSKRNTILSFTDLIKIL